MQKPAALYFWCAMSFVYFLGNILKSMYGEDRPYWVTDDIKATSCHLGFGNPSGHMLNNVFFWLSLYLHQYYEVGVIKPRMSVFCTAYIIKMAVTCIGVTFLIFMGFSRIYLGAHTFNQVLFGTILGITLAYIGHYRVKPRFLEMPEKLYEDSTGSKYAVSCMSYIKVIALALLLPMAVAGCVLLAREGSQRAFYHSNQFRYR